MAFDLDHLLLRFEHAPTDLHQFDEQHQTVIDKFKAFVEDLVPLLPYGQEVEDAASLLVAAAERVHDAIDRIEQTGTVKVGGQIIATAPIPEPDINQGGTPPAPADTGVLGEPQTGPTDSPTTIPAEEIIPPAEPTDAPPPAPVPADAPIPAPPGADPIGVVSTTVPPEAAVPAPGVDPETA